ncbi:putative lipid II flippase FtsW [bacterium]|jgi:cell division protein FtsW|nr:putative lipid II flippase FtsW [bacterium]
MKAIDKILPWVFFCLILALCSFGALMVYSSSVYVAERIYSGNQYYYFKREVMWLIMGFGAMALMYKIPIDLVKRLAPIIYLASLLFLIMVFTPLGVTVNGARRWLNLGFLRFQPSEALKYSMILILAWWYERVKRESGSFIKGAVIPACIMGMGLALALAGRDLGTPLLIAMVGGAICFAAGMKFRYIAVGIVTVGGLGCYYIIHEPYRVKRIMAFLNPMADPLGTGYQNLQALMAICSGKLTGLGIGNSLMKMEYLPEAHTDFIYAVIGEELGFCGSAAVIAAFFLLVVIMWRLVSKIDDTFCRLTAFGIALVIGSQAIANIGVVTATLPNKGMGLPFISYGGSSLLFLLGACGLFLNMVKNKPKVQLTKRSVVSRTSAR